MRREGKKEKGKTNLVVLENESALDVIRKFGVILAETRKSSFFVSEDTCRIIQLDSSKPKSGFNTNHPCV